MGQITRRVVQEFERPPPTRASDQLHHGHQRSVVLSSPQSGLGEESLSEGVGVYSLRREKLPHLVALGSDPAADPDGGPVPHAP